MRTILIALLLLVQNAHSGPSFRLAEPIQVVGARVSYQFSQSIRFEATLVSGDPIQKAYILFQPEGGKTVVEALAVDSNDSIVFTLDVRQQPIRPFSRVYYWFRVTTSVDQEYTSPSYWFDYNDNRFHWQTLEDPIFRVHWYQGSLEFGQTAQNTAHSGLAEIQKRIPLPDPADLDIYIYSSLDDLQPALEQGGQTWVGGHTNPDLGVILISADPNPQQNYLLERQIPHELMHILLYRSLGGRYANLPAWLTEGLASIAELYPNPDYPRALDAAKAGQGLLPVESLCGTFPQEAGQAITAYAEAASFTRYLGDRFGYTGIDALIQQYRRGVGCSEGLRITFGLSIEQLESDWKQEVLGLPASMSGWQQIAPYFFLMGIVLLIPVVAVFTWLGKKKGQDQKRKGYV